MILNWWSVITIFIIRLLAPAITYSYTIPTIHNVYHIKWDYQYLIFFEVFSYSADLLCVFFHWTKIDSSIRSSRNLLAAKTFLNNYCLSSKLFAYDKYVMLIHKCSFDVFYDGFFLPHILSIYCWQASKCSRNNQDWYFHLW